MKPKLFIGSSTETLDVAYAIQENLQRDTEATVWTQGIFELSNYTLEALVEALLKFDFAAFVFSPDDVVLMRDEEHRVTRDNVVFELGLFVGKLGKERCFIIIPTKQRDYHMPTDLLGITPAEYEHEREDQNIVAALGPACNKMRRMIKKLGIIGVEPSEASSSTHEEYDDADIVSLLESWLGSRPESQNTIVMKYIDIDRELSLPLGSTKKQIENAAKRWGYQARRKGENTILFEKPKHF